MTAENLTSIEAISQTQILRAPFSAVPGMTLARRDAVDVKLAVAVIAVPVAVAFLAKFSGIADGTDAFQLSVIADPGKKNQV